MDTNEKQPPQKAITIEDLERRQHEFDVPEGAIAAFKAGAMEPIVFLRSTREPYLITSPEDNCPPGEPRQL